LFKFAQDNNRRCFSDAEAINSTVGYLFYQWFPLVSVVGESDTVTTTIIIIIYLLVFWMTSSSSSER